VTPGVVLRGLVAVCAVGILIAVVDLGHVAQTVLAADGTWLLVAAGALAVSTLAKGVTWHGCLAALPGSGTAVPRGEVLGAFLVGALLNACLPARAGDAARVTIVAPGGRPAWPRWRDRSSPSTLVSTAVWGLLVAGVAPFLPLPVAARAAALAIGLGAVAAIVLAARMSPAPGVDGRRGGRARAALADTARSVRHTAGRMRRPRPLTELTGSAALHWAGQWGAVWTVLIACGLGGLGPLGAAAVVVSLALAQAIPVAPGGVGTAQAGVAIPLVAAGVGLPEALAAGVVLQGVETGITAVLWAVWLPLRRRPDPGTASPVPAAAAAAWPPWRPARGRGGR